MKEQTLKKFITFSPYLWEQVGKLQDKKGFLTEAETVRFCIAHTFADNFKDYIRAPMQKLTIEEKAEREVAQAELIKKIRAEKPLIDGKAICKRLEGREEDQYCYWTGYELRGNNPEETRSERQPLIYLSEADVDNQYIINGDKVGKAAYLKHKAKLNA